MVGRPLERQHVVRDSWSGNSWSGSTWSGSSWSGNAWSGGSSWSGNLERQFLVGQLVEREQLERQLLERRLLELEGADFAPVKRPGAPVDDYVNMSIPAASTIPRRRLFSGVGLIRLYVGCLVACATLVWAGILLPWTPSLDREMLPRLLALAALAYATEAWVVHVHYRRQAHTLSLNEIVIVLGLFYVPSVALLIAQLVGATLALSINRRQRSVKLMFNIAQLVLTTGLAVNIFQLVLGSRRSRATAAGWPRCSQCRSPPSWE